jgi:membrane protease YdiL (CAAX protease family)
MLGLMARRRWPHFSVEAFPSRARRAAALLLLTITLGLTVFVPLQSMQADESPSLEGAPFLSLFAAHGVLLLCLFGWWALSGFPSPLEFLHIRTQGIFRRVVLGVAVGLSGWVVTIIAMAIVGTLVGAIDGHQIASSAGAAGGGDSIPDVVRTIVGLSPLERLVLVLSAGIFEEAFFRSFLQSRSGLLLSSLLFSASHASYGLPLMLVGVFTVSIVLGTVFRATDDALPCMVAHSVFDGVQLFLILPAVIDALPGSGS